MSADKSNNQKKRGRAPRDVTWVENKKIHPGSYAHPVQRKLLNVDFPDIEPSQNTTKRKVCLLIGYIGEGYSGFQVNEGIKTLQADLELAMYKVGAIHKLNFGFPHKIGWSVAGRTDKGVHAAAQVVSCKLEFQKENQSNDDLRQLLNDSLSESIRVLDICKTTQKFNAKTNRDKVRYRYLVPSFCVAATSLPDIEYPNNDQRPGAPVSESEMKDILPQLQSVRISKDQLQSFRSNLALYQGTKAYHNFTRRLSHKDPSARRYIISFEAEDPILHQGMEWIPTVVVGQSFLLHQIRKMITHAIMATREVCTFEEGFAESFNIPPAPPEGLFLDMNYYDLYNRKKQQSNSDCAHLDWTQPDTDAYQRWKDFKDRIVRHIMQEEQEQHNFVQFLYAQEYRRRFPFDDEKEAATDE